MMDYSEKMQRCHDYVQALEEEKRKIEVFQRELPLCLELVTQAIETCKQQLSGTTTTEYMHEQSECSDHTSSDRRPVLEEFIPIKRVGSPCSDDDEDEEDQQSNKTNNTDKKKSDWLRSVQLWNQNPDPPAAEQDVASKKEEVVVEVNRNGGAFKPFHKEKNVAKSNNSNASPVSKPPSLAPATATSSSAETVTRESGGKKEEKDKDGQRKQRRCWSPELHRRFLQALQQLGGSHAATPKQIRELMKVEGLTNDEVKSHLQKYRLHTRRPSSRIHNNGNQQAPQFLVVGGIWVPPGDYAAVAATTAASGEATSTVPATTNGIYAPIAAPPPPTTVPRPSKPRQNQSDERGSHSEGGAHSHSPSTSNSSTHTTTASHVL